MAKQARSLNGKVVAITGGARGIGRATAQALLREGAKVAIGDLDGDLAQKTAIELGAGATAFSVDVTERDSFARFLDAVEAQLGPLDVIVNNAGIMPLGRFAEEDDLTARRMVDINVHGVLIGMKLAIPRFEGRGWGHIVNIASQAGKAGFPGGATYCATKHAVVGVSEAVRAELRGTDIHVSCVMPAVVNTELAAGLKEARGMKNLEPEDVANAIVDALKFPKFDVWVPKSTAAISKVMNLLPRSGREGIARLLKADKVLAEADTGKRAGYEERAAQAAPKLGSEAAPAEAEAESPTQRTVISS